MIKNVRLIFKTHLDIGFTDFAETVKRKYLDEYIPNAIKVGRELLKGKTPFVWTLGSWLIAEALNEDENGMVDEAIKLGILRWHALPFTTHTECMTAELFEEGLKISARLDERYGVRTRAAKMTDVPGHTQAMIPLLQKYGVKLLHIGVNSATPKPNVPDKFIWEFEGSRIAVIYNGGGYGGDIAIGDDLFVFAHTNDNLGPQSAEEIISIYAEMQKKYPTAYISAATLEDLYEALDTSGFVTIDEEIGDSWIHGIGTDPYKVAAFRATLRYAKEKKLPIPQDMLLTAEHTWGLCIQRFYPKKEGWSLAEFEKTEDEPMRRLLEKSWSEQRDYVFRSAEGLGFDLTEELACKKPNLSDYQRCEHEPRAKLSWQLFSAADYRRYKTQYVSNNENWAIWDYTKNGLPEYEGGTVAAEVVASYKKDDTYVTELRFPREYEIEHGVPHFYVIEDGAKVEIRMFGKKKSRIPQALWLSFSDFSGEVEVCKLGRWIKPETSLCSPLIMGFDSGIRNERTEILSLDAALIAPFGKNLLQYGIELPRFAPTFNLYNNIWNTNFPMWWGEDMKFRFVFKKR